jgi:hypothetical protein
MKPKRTDLRVNLFMFSANDFLSTVRLESIIPLRTTCSKANSALLLLQRSGRKDTCMEMGHFIHKFAKGNHWRSKVSSLP